MIRRRHDDGATLSEALYSGCGTYRYFLSRRWDPGRRLLWVMLNPSTATESVNDPTIARCEGRARRTGYGAVGIANLFNLRETDPKRMLRHPDPVGPEAEPQLAAALDWADDIAAAWGNDAARHPRTAQVCAALRGSGKPLYHLVMNRTGHPRHPLYVAEAQPLVPWPDD